MLRRHGTMSSGLSRVAINTETRISSCFLTALPRDMLCNALDRHRRVAEPSFRRRRNLLFAAYKQIPRCARDDGLWASVSSSLGRALPDGMLGMTGLLSLSLPQQLLRLCVKFRTTTQ